MKKDTIAAISTGMTNSGIGIVRLSGNEALEIADKVYRGKEKITEISASDKLAAFRAEQEGYLWPSFGPISAYKEHGAIVHYSATEETDVELRPEGLLLSDTGGNYWEGSTDITRTIALGEVSAEEKRHFTTVAISMLKLAGTTFLMVVQE